VSSLFDRLGQGMPQRPDAFWLARPFSVFLTFYKMCLKLYKLHGNATKMLTNFMQKDIGSLLDQLMHDHVSRVVG
jgi:hypothetical protein